MKSLTIKYALFSMLVVLVLGYVCAVPGPGLAQEPVLQLAPLRSRTPEPPPPGMGFIPPPMDLSHLKGDRMPKGIRPAALPSSFDWRTQGKVTYVQDQNPCGACYAFAALGNFESKILIDGQGTYDFSENNAKECNWYGASCGGGNYYMLASMFSKTGTVLESCDPYVASDVACNSTCPYQKTLLDWRIISGDAVADTEVLKNYIYTYGPVYTAMYASFPGFPTYDGSYTLYHAGMEYPNHAVLIVGWDDSLIHTGGTGGWIVKNSWGTGWGGTCGYGTEAGYFTIAYGSARIGTASSFIYDWQDYDPTGQVMYYDEGGWAGEGGYGNTTAWGLCKFTPSSSENVTRVEFWTTDRTTDVDIYIYDNFVLGTLSGLLASKLNNSFDEAGYHSVLLDSPLAVTAGDDVIAVVKFTNDSYNYPIAVDFFGPTETQRTYTSSNGSFWSESTSDVGIRLRTGTEAANNPPYTPSSPSPANGATGVWINADLSWTGGDPDPGDTVTYDVYFEANDPTPDDLICDDASIPVCDPGTLAYDTQHYWYVVATDNHGTPTTGTTWNFTTGSTDGGSEIYLPLVFKTAMTDLYIQNNLGTTLHLTIYNVGTQDVSTGLYHWGTFPSGTYDWYGEASGYSPSSGTQTFPEGEVLWTFSPALSASSSSGETSESSVTLQPR